MIARQIGIVLCRVGAAVLTVEAFRALGYSLPSLFFGNDGLSFEPFAFIFLSVVPGLVAVCLWVFADQISTVADQTELRSEQESITGVDLIRIGTALIGIYLLVTGIRNGATVEVTSLVRPDPGPGKKALEDEWVARDIGFRVSYLAQLILGFVLVAGRDRIAIWLSKAKSAGVDKSSA